MDGDELEKYSSISYEVLGLGGEPTFERIPVRVQFVPPDRPPGTAGGSWAAGRAVSVPLIDVADVQPGGANQIYGQAVSSDLQVSESQGAKDA